MTPTQVRAAALLELRRRQSKQKPLSFREFIQRCNPRFQFYKHCEVLIAVLQRVADGELKRVQIFCPPRHGKSEIASRMFPAYCLYLNPNFHVGLTHYESRGAEGYSRDARGFYLEAGGKVKHDTRSVKEWLTEQNGKMWATGMGGALTGKGYHIGIIDDPIKSRKAVYSAKLRSDHKKWYRDTFATREEPQGAQIIINTRWHKDDLSGWLMTQEDVSPEHWHFVVFEAIRTAEPYPIPPTCTIEPDWRDVGEALCPERYPLSKLEQIRAADTEVFNSLYQQRPSAVEGNLFKKVWWKFYHPKGRPLPPVPIGLEDGTLHECQCVEVPDGFDTQILSFDFTFKDSKNADFTVGQAWGQKHEDRFLLDQVRAKMDFMCAQESLVKFSEKWPDAKVKLVEDKANGPAIISSLRRKISGLIPVNPTDSKEARAQAILYMVESGNVYLPHPLIAPWVTAFIEELATFPNGANDDQVDACTQALSRLEKHGGKRLPSVHW